MNDRCETVTIVGQDGNSLIINKTDFDEKKHKLFKPEAEKKEAEPDTFDREAAKAYLTEKGVEFKGNAKNEVLEELVNQTKEAEVKPRVEEKDGKFIVLDAKGESIGQPHETEEAALNMLAAIGG